VDSTPSVEVAKDEATVAAWRARSSVAAVEELRPDGSFNVKAISDPAAGAVANLLVTGSGLGDGLIGFLQGDPDHLQVAASVVDAPPLAFAVQVPPSFIRNRHPLISWDPAPNALGGVRYTVQIGRRTVARNLTRTSLRVAGAKLREGRSKVLVTAIDRAGQMRTGTEAMLQFDSHAPRVRIVRRGRGISVRISDGRRGSSAGVKQSSVVVSFGDGKRGRHKSKLRHRYAKRGSYRVVVKVRDRAGNHATIKRRVRVR
jgi:hypothetical protein